MITRFHVQNYKALRDVTLDLGPMTVLIGPNDSGKTSILEALAALCRSVDSNLRDSFAGRWEGAELVWQQDAENLVTLGAGLTTAGGTLSYELRCQFLSDGQDVGTSVEAVQLYGTDDKVFNGRRGATIVREFSLLPNVERDPFQGLSLQIHDALSGVQLYHWVPEHLALPVSPDVARPFQIESTGFGLARCLEDLLGEDRDRFNAIEDRFRHIFPEFDRIQLRRMNAFRAPRDVHAPLRFEPAPGKGLFFALANGRPAIPAAQASDGVLLVLAYLTILHLPRPPRVLLVEEPENSIHPRRLRDVLTILRELITEQQHTQVVLTTHSPYVLDLFDPSEVTQCRKGADGAVTTLRLSESPLVIEQAKTFTLGEIWTAEGEDAIASVPETAGSIGR